MKLDRSAPAIFAIGLASGSLLAADLAVEGAPAKPLEGHDPAKDAALARAVAVLTR